MDLVSFKVKTGDDGVVSLSLSMGKSSAWQMPHVLCCLGGGGCMIRKCFFWVWSSTLTPTRPRNRWQRTNTILIIQQAKGSKLMCSYRYHCWSELKPLVVSRPAWYLCLVSMALWPKWCLAQRVTPLLDEDVSRRRWRDAKVMHLLDWCLGSSSVWWRRSQSSPVLGRQWCHVCEN